MGLLYNDMLCIGTNMKHPRPWDRMWLEKLRRAPIYELSEVIPLYDGHINPAIPKRPPHDLMWAEWTWLQEGTNGVTDWTIGAILQRLDIDGPAALKAVDESRPEPPRPEIAQAINRSLGSLTLSDQTRSTIRDSIACYRLDILTRTNATTMRGILPNKIDQKLGHYLIFFGEEYLTMTHTRQVPVNLQELTNKSIFGLSARLCVYTESSPFCAPWPLEMCFSLLHCHNVVKETINPTPKEIRQAHREHRQPDRSYKVIRLEKPLRSGDGKSDRRQRFHLVRGHFKNLQADRYVLKGWHWWPEHWRGDEKLGVVKTVSKLRP